MFSFSGLWQLLVLLSSPIWVSLLIWLLSFSCWMFYFHRKGYRRKTSSNQLKSDGFIRRVFWLFPRRLSLDLYTRDPDEFREYGLHMFCGEQGSGKTISVVHKLQELQKRYPRALIRSNMGYIHQHGEIGHWRDLVAAQNGVFGQIEVLDEIQTWFSSNQSKDFPVEMLTEISQQRKQRKMLIGTAQVFSRISKPIREQTTRVYLPLTIFGCLTWVRVTKPDFWDDEKQVFKRYLGHYFFVHSDVIRNAFDTYLKIEKYKESGFKPDSDQLRRIAADD